MNQVNVNGIMIGFEAARWTESVGCDPAEDVRRVQAGETDRARLLAECLDQANASDRSTIEEYVSDVMAHVLRATPWALHLVNQAGGTDPDSSARVMEWHRNLADAMNAGERYLKEHRSAFLQVQLGEDGVVHNVEL